MAKKEEKQKFGDIIENHDLIKRTLMVAAFPALVKQTKKDGEETYEGFLPGFEFAQIEDIASEEELVEILQDMLDDEVEELVVFGKSLPMVDEDEVLLEKYPEHKIVYLDINVYATKEELDYYDSCTHDCSSCGHHCHDENCDCEEDFDDCDCCDDDCDCGDDCDDDCDCGCHHDDCCDDKCDCNEHHHNHEDVCSCHYDEDCCGASCGEDKKGKKTTKKSGCKSKK